MQLPGLYGVCMKDYQMPWKSFSLKRVKAVDPNS